MKCKIFRHVFANDAENAINKWLEESKSRINIEHMTQATITREH